MNNERISELVRTATKSLPNSKFVWAPLCELVREAPHVVHRHFPSNSAGKYRRLQATIAEMMNDDKIGARVTSMLQNSRYVKENEAIFAELEETRREDERKEQAREYAKMRLELKELRAEKASREK